MYSSTHKRGCFCIGMNSFELLTRLLRIADVKERLFFYGGKTSERTIQTMGLAQIYEMLNGVEGGADAVASLKKAFAVLCNKAKNF